MRLERDLEGEAVQIFFTKLSVQLQNQEMLFKMPRELIRFNCLDEGDVTGISCPANVCLLLKPGAKAMIVWNLSQKVRDGSMATFLRAQDNTLDVDIENHGTVLLKR